MAEPAFSIDPPASASKGRPSSGANHRHFLAVDDVKAAATLYGGTI